jgi:DNA-binding NarL/FixJ family response regulator
LLEKIRTSQPDVLLIDPEFTHPETVRSLKQIIQDYRSVQVAIFTGKRDKEAFILAMQLGIRGYLSKDISLNELLSSISLISAGELVISPIFTEYFFFNILRSVSNPANLIMQPILSLREIEVLSLISIGATNREIAQKLYIAVNTVKVHLKNILDKLQLRNRQQLAVYAIKQGLTNCIK